MRDENNYIPLPEAVLITEQHWPEGTMPLVYTRTMTYNHIDYIRECIEGILMQKTTFPVRVLIHDDASTDGTAEIVREYAAKYPNVIKAFFQEENAYAKPDRMDRHATFSSWRVGKYEAICEGDDYWTDSHKLQKQVSLLESHPDCVMCVAKTKELRVGNESKEVTYEGLPKQFLNFDDFFNGCYVHTSTYVISKVALNEMQKWRGKMRLTDTSMRFILSDLGPAIFLPEVVSRYRITGAGIWTKLSEKEQIDEHIELFASFYTHFKKKYKSRFLRRVLKYCRAGIRLCIKNKDVVNGFRYIRTMLKYRFSA